MGPMTDHDLAAHLTIADVCELAGAGRGVSARRLLRRRILARERALGAKILLRNSPLGPYYTTLHVLRLHMPELFPQPMQPKLLDLFTEYARSHDESHRRLETEIRALRARTNALAVRLKSARRDT